MLKIKRDYTVYTLDELDNQNETLDNLIKTRGLPDSYREIIDSETKRWNELVGIKINDVKIDTDGGGGGVTFRSKMLDIDEVLESTGFNFRNDDDLDNLVLDIGSNDCLYLPIARGGINGVVFYIRPGRKPMYYLPGKDFCLTPKASELKDKILYLLDELCGCIAHSILTKLDIEKYTNFSDMVKSRYMFTSDGQLCLMRYSELRKPSAKIKAKQPYLTPDHMYWDLDSIVCCDDVMSLVDKWESKAGICVDVNTLSYPLVHFENVLSVNIRKVIQYAALSYGLDCVKDIITNPDYVRISSKFSIHICPDNMGRGVHSFCLTPMDIKDRELVYKILMVVNKVAAEIVVDFEKYIEHINTVGIGEKKLSQMLDKNDAWFFEDGTRLEESEEFEKEEG